MHNLQVVVWGPSTGNVYSVFTISEDEAYVLANILKANGYDVSVNEIEEG